MLTMLLVATIRVLIADDHAIARSDVRLMLDAPVERPPGKEEGSGAEAQVRVSQPDVVLLEMSPSGENGMEAITALRDAAPDTRILVSAVHADGEYARSALASGANGYLVNGVGHDEFVSAIRAVYSGHTYVSESVMKDVRTKNAQPCMATRSARQPHTSLTDLLSRRERQVLEFVAYGHTHKDIAAKLDVSVKSIETYRARVADKLGLRTRAALVRFALDNGMLQPGRNPFA